MRDAGKRMRWGLGLCLAALLWSSGCVTVVPAGSPPPCPEWSEDATKELSRVLATRAFPELELQIARQLVYCEQIDAMREPRVERIR